MIDGSGEIGENIGLKSEREREREKEKENKTPLVFKQLSFHLCDYLFSNSPSG